MLHLTKAGEKVLQEGATPVTRLCHALFSEPEGLDHHQIARLFGSDQKTKLSAVSRATDRGFVLKAGSRFPVAARKREVLRVRYLIPNCAC